LLDALHRLGYPVVAAHLDHGLRTESAAEAQAVQQFAARLGAPCVVERQAVANYAAAEGLSIEEAARVLRYRFLFAAAEGCQAQAVAVGHNADDQVETVMMHFLRGAGLSGLRGMAYYSRPNTWSQARPLVRPLLGIWRDEILAYCTERGLQPAFDQSNQDTTFLRNRLRQDLIPALEAEHPGLRQRVWRMAEVLAGDYGLVEQVVEAAWEACQTSTGPGWVRFQRQELAAQPEAVQRHLLRRAVGYLRPGRRDFGFEAVARAQEALARPGRAGVSDVMGGLCVRVEAQQAWLATWEADLPLGWPQAPVGEPLPLAIPGEVQLGEGWVLQAERRPLESAAYDNADPFQAWLDAEAVTQPLVVRTRRPSERFAPLGMDGKTVKLAEFMLNQKLPRRARARWPLVCAGAAPAWLPGYRLDWAFRLTQATRQVVYLALRRK
jgi:tRNA(Ile)-lysidine synthase